MLDAPAEPEIVDHAELQSRGLVEPNAHSN
jgi:hypothetical protein